MFDAWAVIEAMCVAPRYFCGEKIPVSRRRNRIAEMGRMESAARLQSQTTMPASIRKCLVQPQLFSDHHHAGVDCGSQIPNELPYECVRWRKRRQQCVRYQNCKGDRVAVIAVGFQTLRSEECACDRLPDCKWAPYFLHWLSGPSAGGTNVCSFSA